jgi:hypothetical protein
LRPERAPRHLAAAIVSLALLAAGCGTPAEPATPRPSTPAYRPSGTLLMEVGTFDHRMVAYELPSGPARQFETPFYGGAFGGGFWGGDGTVLSMVPNFGFGQNGQSRLNRLVPNGGARPIGPWLPGTLLLDVRGNRAAAWGCFKSLRTIRVIDLSSGGGWTKVADGCSAALSPDGAELAYVDHGALFKLALPDGSPERLLDLHSVSGLAEADVATFEDGQTSMAWGPGGIAVAVGNTGGYGLVVYRPGERPRVVGLGSAVTRQLEWQPTGRLLAFGDFVPGDQVAEVRLFDPTTGAITEVAVAANYGQFKWAPDGSVLAVARADYVLAVVDTQGRTLATVPTRGIPDDWAP